MSAIDDGGPAYPQHGWSSNPEVIERMRNQGGMTLRDWFAGQALAGTLANQNTTGVMIAIKDSGGRAGAVMARMSYEFADAMLAARKGANHD